MSTQNQTEQNEPSPRVWDWRFLSQACRISTDCESWSFSFRLAEDLYCWMWFHNIIILWISLEVRSHMSSKFLPPGLSSTATSSMGALSFGSTGSGTSSQQEPISRTTLFEKLPQEFQKQILGLQSVSSLVRDLVILFHPSRPFALHHLSITSVLYFFTSMMNTFYLLQIALDNRSLETNVR